MALNVRVQLCGRLAVEDGGQRVDARLPGRQGRLLFAYLVVNADRAVTRDELAFAVWGDGLPADLDTSLNALVSKVRAAVGRARIAGRGELRFEPGDEVLVDVHTALDAVHRAEAHTSQGQWLEGWQPAHTAFQIARRQFLLGHEAPWVDDWRRRLDAVATTALECHCRCCLELAGPTLPAAERAGRLLIDRAPYRESAYVVLMEILERQGNPAEALQLFKQAERVLRDELGVAPGAELARLRDRLLGLVSKA